MRTYYHGSAVGDLTILKPNIDPRTGIKGIFIAKECYAPMVFSLLPDRAHAIIEWEIKNGKFIEGKVTTPMPLHKEGWLYEIKPPQRSIKKFNHQELYCVDETPVINKRKVTQKEIIDLGWRIMVDEKQFPTEPRIEVVYEEDDFIIINKPAGVLVHDIKNKLASNSKVLTHWLVKHYPSARQVGDNPKERPGIVHRLDRDTSGLMIVCLTQNAFNYFKKQFQEHKIRKIYQALVNGIVKDNRGIIDKPIGIKSGSIKRTTHTKAARLIKEAVTKYKVIEKFQEKTLLEVEPLTGRTHQIRVHLAAINHSVVGDKIYGGQKNKNEGRLYLHAQSLEFINPRGKKVKIEVDNDWRKSVSISY